MTVILNDFPDGKRGTFYFDDKDEEKLNSEFQFAKKLLNQRSLRTRTPFLLTLTYIPGKGVRLMWWPAHQPKHQPDDIYLDGTSDSLRLSSK